ncbi:unnamed protein product [Hymenolepis diminuta]|uniref:EF-hand domain-containing protein n=2 Tax=Hymenolepis diminuta TaxID=6216 RepID=A0A564YHW4_HYMDI|nr:unnamed protein product [Hymenolepis diminuta]
MTEELKEVYFNIDKNRTDAITIADLEKYRQENNLSEDFIHQWQKLFDPDSTGVITLQKFLDILCLNRMEDQNKDEPIGTIEGQQELLQIAEDMEPDKQKAIFELVQQVEDVHGANDRDIVRSLKTKLDDKYGRLWHIFIVKGQFHAFYSYEGGNSFCFKKGPRIYIIYKTPKE